MYPMSFYGMFYLSHLYYYSLVNFDLIIIFNLNIELKNEDIFLTVKNVGSDGQGPSLMDVE